MAATSFNATFGLLSFKVLDERKAPVGVTRPFLLIGGLTSIKEDWEPLSLVLAESRPVITYDSRGMGESGGVEAEITVQTLAQDAADLLAHLNITEVDVLGFSFGAIVLLELLLKITPPVTFHHVVFAAGRPYPSTPASAMPKPTLGKIVFREPLAGDASCEKRREYWAPFVHLMYDEEWLAAPENQGMLSEHIDRSAQGMRNEAVYRRQLASLKSFDYRPNLHYIRPSTQVLVIHGKKDRVVPYDDSEAFFAAIPHAKRITGLPGDYGHWWHGYFNEDIWVEQLNAFLDDRPLIAKSKL